MVGITRGTNPKWDKGIWRTFHLYYIKDNTLKQIFIDNGLQWSGVLNWNERKRCFESKVLGMDRTFEIVYNLSDWLYKDGYKLKAERLQ